MKTLLVRSVPSANRLAALTAACMMLAASCQSCGPAADLRNFADADLFPPVLENILPVDAETLRIEFNEPVSIGPDASITPELGAISAEPDGNSLILSLGGSQTAGTKYTINAEVTDETGNRMSFLAPFYGFNSDLPDLLINEFTTQGSSTHPDTVELLVTGGGNTAGVWIVEGTTGNPEESITLPSCRVEAGDYLLIHFKPQGIPEEIDEADCPPDTSGGYDAYETARDFWVPGGTGLSGNNGVIAVYNCPGGAVMDAVLYSNRTSLSDESYLGFGSTSMLEKAREITEEGGWTAGGDGGEPRPEDGINPDDSTATRSICRASEPSDTNTAGDWHIVPTSSYSFGTINTDEVYTP